MPNLYRQSGQAQSHFSLVGVDFPKGIVRAVVRLDSFRRLSQHPEKRKTECASSRACKKGSLQPSAKEEEVKGGEEEEVKEEWHGEGEALPAVVYICPITGSRRRSRGGSLTSAGTHLG
jgi:hypothetical protein